jgi:hypothetical protein
MASAPALAMIIAVAPATGASASPASLHSRAVAAALATLRHLFVGEHPTNHAAGGHAPRAGRVTPVQSTNWAGYADDNTAGNTYSTVTGHWTEPSVTCDRRTKFAAFWVGIDGFTSGTVEQDGTLAECNGGSAFYFTWWEMFPSNAIQVVGQTLMPGNQIFASVQRNGASYTLSVTDTSTPGDSFSTTQTCSTCANSSAEWIAEAPSNASGVLPLANFHIWTLKGATVNPPGVISSFPDDEITMVDGAKRVKARPGVLDPQGDGFNVKFVRST